MVLVDRARAALVSRGFPRRIRFLPKSSALLAGRSALSSRLVRGVTWLSASILLGLWAHGASMSDSIRTWKLEHPPSERVWNASLRTLSFVPVRDPLLVQKALRALPLNLDSRGSAWNTQDGNWVAVLRDSGAPPLLFARNQDRSRRKLPIPAAWQNAGLGWDGFESALKRIESIPFPQGAPVLPARRKMRTRDPRAIVY
jgi:hypothetical protein